ncbi:MAG: cell wall hydrolase [Lachnospiraceae bacterium]|nr:cell wall hydrolase [Lachnospiraceae bacterium]
MKFRKLVLECGIIAASFAVVSAPSAVSVSAAEIVSGTWNAEAEQDNRGSSEFMQDLKEKSEEDAAAKAAAAEESSAEEVSEEEPSEWENKLLVVVEEDSSLNIRAGADANAEVVGKMYRGSAAEVIERGEEWSRIVSGEVEGYVKNEYCVFAEEAEAQAEKICDAVATVTADGVRLRSEANVESTICEVLDAGDALNVWKSGEEAASPADDEAQNAAAGETDVTDGISSEENSGEDAQNNGWIAVEYGDMVAYISADYVEVELQTGEALSMEEIYAQQAAARAAAAEAAAERAAAEQQASAETVTASTGTAVSASTDDVTLLAALIQCEAGGESYDGQLAVGAVVMNRVKSGSFPNSISGVIYQSGQFAPASSGKLSRVLSSGSISSSCYQAAQAAIGGADNTGGAKYFHAGSGNGTVIGNQVFY